MTDLNPTTQPPLLERLFSLAGKRALVTGASSGIGRALAQGLAEAGAAVAVHGRNPDEIARTCESIAQAGGRAVPVTADLSDPSSVSGLMQQTVDALGGLDILVNCAGTNRRKRIVEVTEDDYDFIMNVNLKSVFFLTQAAYPHLKAQGGKVVHVGSINVNFGLDTVSVYGASKGGLHQVTKVMAVEWAPDDIQVNAIVPGFFYTPLTRGIWDDPARSRWFRGRIPSRRPGRPEDLVGVTLLLASPAGSYITGQTFIVDGGFDAGGSWHRDEEV